MLLTVAVLLIGCSDQPEPGVDVGPAQERFLRYCASCHGNAGEGKPPAFPPLTDPEWAGLPGEVLALIVLFGLQGEIEVAGRSYRGFMPPMQHMSDEDIALAVGYIEEQWGRGRASLEAADVAALRADSARRSPWRGRDELVEALDELP